MRDHSHEREQPLDELRSLWNEVEPERGLDQGQETEDDATRAVVDWMRAAWQATSAPALAAPVAREVRRRITASLEPVRGPQAMRVPSWLVVLPFAAAALFAWRLSVPAADAPPRTPSNERPDDSLYLASADAGHEPIRPLFHEDGSVEFVSGSVRLHLVSAPQASTTPIPPEPAQPELDPIR